MANTLSDDQWAAIDPLILAGSVLPALLLVRECAGVGLNEAKDIHFQRYQRLQSERPGDFACTDEEYWAGVYS